MTLEMKYLTMYGLLVILITLIQVLISASQHGFLKLLGNRENLNSVGIAERAEKTVQNSIVAMALITPAGLSGVSMMMSGSWSGAFGMISRSSGCGNCSSV